MKMKYILIMLSFSLISSSYQTITNIKKMIFNEVKIGNQIWSDKNLNVSEFNDGTKILEVKTNEEWLKALENKTPAWCYYDNNINNGEKYGKLYNWYAIKNKKNLAPIGWHIPNSNEWNTLLKHLGGSISASPKLKSITGWNESYNGNNLSGFNGLPSGGFYYGGRFGSLGVSASFWVKDNEQFIQENGVNILLLAYDDSMSGLNLTNEDFGFSVRCIKDTK